VKCKNCDNENPSDALYCAKCGTKLDVAPGVIPRVPAPATSVTRSGFWKSYGWIIAFFVIIAAVIGIAAMVYEPNPPPATTSKVTPVQTTGTTGYQIGNTAPDFQLTDLAGRNVTLSSLRGKPVVLNFWATWCGPCKAEMPFLQQVYNERKGTDIIILTIDLGESLSKVQGFLTDNKLTLPVLLDTTQTTAKQYGISAIPTTFFIDGNGIIQNRRIGSFSNKAQIDAEINNLLQIKAGTTQADTTPPSIPILMSPSDNAIIPQPTFLDGWVFSWNPSVDNESGIHR